MKRMMFVLILCLGMAGLFYINSKLISINSKTEAHISSSINVVKNSPTETEIMIDTVNFIKPTLTVLSENEPVFKGEHKKLDPTLGKYRIEFLFYDANVLNKVREEFKLETKILHNDKGEIVQSARIAYPPDDSMSVLYIGCNTEPNVILENTDGKLKIMISN